MKNLASVFLLYFCLIGGKALAQPGQDGRKSLDAAHVAFITQEVKLTPEEAKQFWPVYNNYQRELQTIREARKAASDKSDAEDELEFDSRVLELKKKYRREFSKILSDDRIGTLFKAERDFREMLIRQLRRKP